MDTFATLVEKAGLTMASLCELLNIPTERASKYVDGEIQPSSREIHVLKGIALASTANRRPAASPNEDISLRKAEVIQEISTRSSLAVLTKPDGPKHPENSMQPHKKTGTALTTLELFDGYLPTFLPLDAFPKTRYQGSKRRLLVPLQDIFEAFKPGTAVDLYSGTATVSLLLRLKGWRVVANDFLLFNNVTARVMLNGPPASYTVERASKELRYLLLEAPLNSEPLVSKNFASIYFHDDENLQIDRFSQNVAEMPGRVRDFYVYCVGQALLMKRPYNLFHRANLEMRTREVARSFGNLKTWNTSILEHASKIASRLLDFSFVGANVEHAVTSHNTLDLTDLPDAADLIYLDPPYLNRSGNGVDYCHFYHFLDGLYDYRLFAGYDERYPHRPIVLKPSAWLNNKSALEELGRILRKWPRANIVLSYRSDGRPTFEDIAEVFRSCGRKFELIDTHDYKYALSNNDDTKELFVISASA